MCALVVFGALIQRKTAAQEEEDMMNDDMLGRRVPKLGLCVCVYVEAGLSGDCTFGMFGETSTGYVIEHTVQHEVSFGKEQGTKVELSHLTCAPVHVWHTLRTRRGVEGRG